jgi:hypothetical protein
MPQEPEVFSITGAAEGMSQDQKGRQRRYLISMGIRTFCFVAGIAATGWLRWTLLVGAVLLPYFSVVVANAGRERRLIGPGLVNPQEQRVAITDSVRD